MIIIEFYSIIQFNLNTFQEFLPIIFLSTFVIYFH